MANTKLKIKTFNSSGSLNDTTINAITEFNRLIDIANNASSAIANELNASNTATRNFSSSLKIMSERSSSSTIAATRWIRAASSVGKLIPIASRYAVVLEKSADIIDSVANSYSSYLNEANIKSNDMLSKFQNLQSSIKTMSLDELQETQNSLKREEKTADNIEKGGIDFIDVLFNNTNSDYLLAQKAKFNIGGIQSQIKGQIQDRKISSGMIPGIPGDDEIQASREKAQALASIYEREFNATRTPVEIFTSKVQEATRVFEVYKDQDRYNRSLQLAQNEFDATRPPVEEAAQGFSAADQSQINEQRGQAQSFFNLQDSLKGQNQSIEESYMERAEIVQNALANEWTDQETAQQMMLSITENYNQQMLASQRQVRDANLSVTSDLFGSMAQLAQQGGAKTFKIWKNLARAQTIISTYSAAQKAFESQIIPGDPTSPIRAYAAAAAAIMAGLARLSSINSTSLSSSSANKSAGGPSTTIGGATASPVMSAAPVPTPQNFNIYINGKLWDAVVDKTEAARELRPYMNELERDTI